MNLDVKLVGLEEALKTMAAAFPKDPKRQRGILNAAMNTSARKNMLEEAKRLARQGDSSGALSESIGIRNQSKRKLAQKGMVAGVEMVPVRTNKKALALYIEYYYTRRGLNAPAGIARNGIRHGHLVEFGSVNNSASPFMLPAARAGQSGYLNSVAGEIKLAVERNVARARR